MRPARRPSAGATRSTCSSASPEAMPPEPASRRRGRPGTECSPGSSSCSTDALRRSPPWPRCPPRKSQHVLAGSRRQSRARASSKMRCISCGGAHPISTPIPRPYRSRLPPRTSRPSAPCYRRPEVRLGLGRERCRGVRSRPTSQCRGGCRERRSHSVAGEHPPGRARESHRSGLRRRAPARLLAGSRADRGRERRGRHRAPLEDPDHAQGAGGGGKPDRDRRVLHRHEPDRARRRAPPRRPRLQRALQQHPERGRDGDGGDRLPRPPARRPQPRGAPGPVEEVRRRLPRGPRQDPGHRGLWPHRPSGRRARRGLRAERRLLRHRQPAPDGQQQARRVARGAARGQRLRDASRPGHGADPRHDRQRRARADEGGRLPHQPQPRQRGGDRGPRGGAPAGAPGRRGDRRLPAGARAPTPSASPRPCKKCRT